MSEHKKKKNPGDDDDDLSRLYRTWHCDGCLSAKSRCFRAMHSAVQ